MTTTRDHTEIALLVSRFFRALDERKFDEGWARAFVTDDVRTVTPIGLAEGAAAVRHTEEAIGRFARTQHLSADVLVDADAASGTATASWNAHMTHVHRPATLERRGPGADPLFTVGGRYDAELRRTDEGWRFSRLAVEALWTTGQPPVLPEGVEPVLPR
ncbi:nuclear transport factor 2 family protein [Streptomyces sp. Ru73]|uniref:nuclear transport factor 2 family protein n=1 Tax=Streptomyces sp. Ru73 TaxID=2080748 RepID=UPI0015E28881|nr:nuclear transport factor 2 family protein [Streptomyces sp. Ru73]